MAENKTDNLLFVPLNPEGLLADRLFYPLDGQIIFKHQGEIVVTAISEDKNFTADAYLSLPEGAPYQLINGKLVFMAAPSYQHQDVLANLHLEIGSFVRQNKLGKLVFAPTDVKLDDQNIIQPDLLFINIKRSNIIQRMIMGTPDFVVEILSPSTEKYDRKNKMKLFGKHGVVEAWLVNINKQEIEVYHNENKKMQLIQKVSKNDSIKSIAIEGFELEVARIFSF